MPNRRGRIRFTVDLGAPDLDQQYTPGAATTQTSRTVTFRPHARVKLPRLRATRHGARVCARAIGGPATARLRVVGRRGAALTHRARFHLRSTRKCRTLRWSRAPNGRGATLRVTAKDRFGHRLRISRTIHLPRRSSRRPGAASAR